MTTYGTYTFDSYNDADCQEFTFVSTRGDNSLQNGVNAPDFCWDDDHDGHSPLVGPEYGQGGNPDGYVYTECSSLGVIGDEYTMTFNTTLDASTESWEIEFYTCQRDGNGHNESTCEVQINENGSGWTTVADGSFGGAGERTSDTTWVKRTVDLSEDGVNIDSNTQVRLLITLDSDADAWYGDYAIDTVTIKGTPITHPKKTDLRIYYDTLSTPNVISSNCSRWDVNDYSITLETWLTKSQLQTLRNNITPGAAGELYSILGKPNYYDTTWQGENTLLISGNNESTLGNMRQQRIIYVKNISDTPIAGTSGYLNVKIEGLISGSVL